MNYKRFIKDIFTLNLKENKVRWHKFIALIKQKTSTNKNFYFENDNYLRVPIVINNFNRLTYLKQLIDWLQNAGYTNLIIIDNKSNYQPLLEYYKVTKAKVIFLKENYGHLAFWKSGIYRDYYSNYYVYTDPDVLPIDTCPKDFMKIFLENLVKYPTIHKIGFSLQIDDLPDHYNKKQDVLKWEADFWKRKIADNIYDAPIDTTFALYKPFTNELKWTLRGYRFAPPLVCKHLPWYEDSNNIDEENLFYIQNMKKGASHWIVKDETLKESK